jgi:hypothetical protein
LSRLKNARPAPAATASGIMHDLQSQRRKIIALASKTGTLQTRGRLLLAESNSLAENLKRSSSYLVHTYHLTKATLEDLRLRGTAREVGLPMRSANGSERVIEDSPDMVEALQQAAEILEMEFTDTEGSGRETLAKCEKVLERTRSIKTIALPLY